MTGSASFKIAAFTAKWKFKGYVNPSGCDYVIGWLDLREAVDYIKQYKPKNERWLLDISDCDWVSAYAQNKAIREQLTELKK